MKLNQHNSFALCNLLSQKSYSPFLKCKSILFRNELFHTRSSNHQLISHSLVVLSLAVIMLLGSYTSTKAQLSPSFSCKTDFAIPVRDLSKLNNPGFGAGMAINFGRKQSLAEYSLSVNFLHFPGRTIPVDYPNLGLTGVDERQADMTFLTTKLGINLHFPDFERLYGGLEIGLGKYLPGETQTPSYRFELIAYPSTTTVLTLGRKLGYLIPVGKHYVDLSLRYESSIILKPFEFGLFDGQAQREDLTLATFIGFSAAYRFSFYPPKK